MPPANRHMVTLGADPELLVKDLRTHAFRPICGLLKGASKGSPRVVDPSYLGMRRGAFAYLEDNVSIEFNIEPATESSLFSAYVQNMYSYIKQSILAPLGLYPAYASSAEFEHLPPEAMIFGCDPDYRSLVGAGPDKRAPFAPETLGRSRFAGGHVHLGYNQNATPPHIMAKLCDLFVALPLLKFDKQGSRRPYYGLPGLYRPKGYGIEYRTLGNFWVMPRFAPLLGSFANIWFSLGYLGSEQVDSLVKVYKAAPWADIDRAVQEGVPNDRSSRIMEWMRSSYANDDHLSRISDSAYYLHSTSQRDLTDMSGIAEGG